MRNYIKLLLVLLAINAGVIFANGCAPQPKQGWQDWYENTSSYIDKTQAILAETNRIVNIYALRFEEIEKYGSSLEAESVINSLSGEAIGNLQRLRNHLIALQPPPDLENYHSLIIKALEYQIRFIDATSKGEDFNQAVEQFTLTLIEATKELRRLFIMHDAPPDYIETQDILIRELSEGLEEY